MPRPTKLTPTLQQQIVRLILAGCYPDVAAGACGVGRATFFEWIARGEGRGRRKVTPLYAAFAEAVQQATDQSEARLVMKLAEYEEGNRPSRRDPTRRVRSRITFRQISAAQWKLARRFPARWGGHVLPELELGSDGEGEAAGGPVITVYLSKPGADDADARTRSMSDPDGDLARYGVGPPKGWR